MNTTELMDALDLRLRELRHAMHGDRREGMVMLLNLSRTMKDLALAELYAPLYAHRREGKSRFAEVMAGAHVAANNTVRIVVDFDSEGVQKMIHNLNVKIDRSIIPRAPTKTQRFDLQWHEKHPPRAKR